MLGAADEHAAPWRAKAAREADFPVEALQHAVSWSIAKSLATEETDRVRLLNAVCEEADLDRVPSIASPAYDALDASA